MAAVAALEDRPHLDRTRAHILAERPKLAPFMDEIRQALAGALNTDLDRVSVKAKTNEGVDAVGRGEAIAAHAVVVLAPGTPA